MPFSHYTKDPNELLTVTLDWEDELGGETIATGGSTWPIQPSGITVVTLGQTATTATIKLSGGTNRQDYRFQNRVVASPSGNVYVWDLLISVGALQFVPTGPPFATIAEAEDYQPAAEGASALKVERVLAQASRMVARIAPRPAATVDALREAMDTTQDTIPLKKADAFPIEGTLRIGDELLTYFGKTSTTGGAWTSGAGNLTNVLRGRHATVPATHAIDAVVEDVEYPLLARDAELTLFEWLWETRGYKPSRTGVIGSESYSIEWAQVKNIVRQAMGPYAGRTQSISVVSSFGRSDYFDRYPDWVGNG